MRCRNLISSCSQKEEKHCTIPVGTPWRAVSSLVGHLQAGPACPFWLIIWNLPLHTRSLLWLLRVLHCPNNQPFSASKPGGCERGNHGNLGLGWTLIGIRPLYNWLIKSHRATRNAPKILQPLLQRKWPLPTQQLISANGLLMDGEKSCVRNAESYSSCAHVLLLLRTLASWYGIQTLCSLFVSAYDVWRHD